MSELVSVITSTHNRHGALVRCCESVIAQTYQDIEHIVVSDGPDEELRAVLPSMADPGRIRFAELGRSWHEFMPRGSYGAAARLAGCLLARGEYITYLDDDDVFQPDHVASLVELIEERKVDFVYSKMAKTEDNHVIAEIGDGFPRYGGIGTPMILHRVGLLRYAMWDPNHGYGEDWGIVQKWLEAGADHAFLNRVTVLTT